jgi:uncharacterized protein YndB with AHSA1/START domain
VTEIRIDVRLSHPPERVWRALTDPKILSEWFLAADLQPVKGTRFTMRPQGQAGFDDEPIEGEVVDVDPPTRLVMRWRATQLQTVVTMSVHRIDDGCRLTLDQNGFVGPRGTLRRRVLHRSYAQMLGDPLSACLDRLAEQDRDRAAQARRRGGSVRTAAGPPRGNESRSFGRRPSQARFGRRVARPDPGPEDASGQTLPASLARLRRLSIRRSADGPPLGRCAVPPTPDGAGRARHPGAVVNGLNPNEPTLALPPFPLRPRWAHERRTTPSARARETGHAIVTRLRVGAPARSASAADAPQPGRSRRSVAIGLALIVGIVASALALDRTMAPAARTARAGVVASPYRVAPGPGSGTAPRPSGTAVTLSAVYRTGRTSASGYQGIITINNLSSAPLDGWTAILTLPPRGLIVHDPRGADYQQTGKEVRFTPPPGARVVAPGTSIEFSFEVQGVGAPVGCVVNGRPCSGIPG